MATVIETGKLVVYMDDGIEMLGRVKEVDTNGITGQVIYLVNIGDGQQTWMNSWAIRLPDANDLYNMDTVAIAEMGI